MLGNIPLRYEPLEIEIVNRSNDWQPYIPPAVGFLGSVIVAAVALYSLRKSNKTNRDAIDAADKQSVIDGRKTLSESMSGGKPTGMPSAKSGTVTT